MIINTKSSVSIPNSLLEKILKKSSKRLANNIEKARNKIHAKIKELVIRQIESSKVMQELRNNVSAYLGKRTIRGEFGLTNEMANNAADVIVKIIENAIKKPSIKETSNSNSTTFDISIAALDEGYRDKLKSSKALSYVSKPSGEIIPWMKWLLDGNASIRKKYGIMYLEGNKDGNVAGSRSGQALMVRDSRLQKTKSGKKRKNRKKIDNYYFPYNLPPELLTKGSAQDFIEEALRSTRFIGKLKILVELELREEINKLR